MGAQRVETMLSMTLAEVATGGRSRRLQTVSGRDWSSTTLAGEGSSLSRAHSMSWGQP